MSGILHATEVRACQQPARVSRYAPARAMTREGWNERGRQTDASKGDGEPTNMAILQKCEGERTEEGERVVRGKDSVTSRWKKRRQYRISKYSPRRSEEKKGVDFGGERDIDSLAGNA